MLLKLNAFFFTLIFAGVLELSVFNENRYFYLLYFLIGFSILVIWPLARKIRFLAIPFFLSIGSLNLLILIDQISEKHIFIGLSSLVYYLALLGAYRLKKYDCDQTAQGMINLATLATVFFWFTSSYGWYLNFDIGNWVLVLVFVTATFSISWPSIMIGLVACKKISYRQKGEKKKSLISFGQYIFKEHKQAVFLNLVLTLIMGEVVLAVSFWPFGYLVTGSILVIVYYVFWDAIRFFIQDGLTSKLLWFNIGWAIVAVGVILITANWKLVV